MDEIGSGANTKFVGLPTVASACFKDWVTSGGFFSRLLNSPQVKADRQPPSDFSEFDIYVGVGGS